LIAANEPRRCCLGQQIFISETLALAGLFEHKWLEMLTDARVFILNKAAEISYAVF